MLSLAGNPPRFASVYKPMLWTFLSDLYPNSNPRTSNINILRIRTPSDQELLDYPSLVSTDMVMTHDFLDPSAIYPGQTIEIFGTDRNLYAGVFRCLSRPSNELMVISATNVGKDLNGRFSVYYNNYTVFLRVTVDNMDPVTLKVKPRTMPSLGDGNIFAGLTVFQADVREVVQRGLGDVFKKANPLQQFGVINADGVIATGYAIDAWEGYDVTTETGTTFRQFNGETDVLLSIKDRVGVNGIVPYHHIAYGGSVDHDYLEDFKDYLVQPVPYDATPRFLTYGSRRTQYVGREEPFFLAFLWQGKPLNVCKVMVQQFAADGSGLGTTFIAGLSPKYAGLVPCGTTAFAQNALCSYYRITLVNNNNDSISETFRINIREKCDEVDRRLYWLNKLGGIDAFTFIDREDRIITARRSTVSKPDMNTYGVGTEYQRRVTDVEVQREYALRSHLLRPEVVRELAEGLFESPNVRCVFRSPWWTELVLLTDSMVADSSNKNNARVSFTYAMGVDNQSQRR